jgi:hypothetical protein
MREYEHGDERLENPFPNFIGLKIVHIVFVDYHCNQLVAQHESQYYARDRDDNRFGQRADKVENAGIPALRSCAHLPRYLADFSVYLIEHSREIRDNALSKHLPYPIGDSVFNRVHPLSTPLPGIVLSIIDQPPFI